MIFFGTRGLTLTGDSGDFFCPNCGSERPYKRRKVRRFFTLYFVPLIPLDLLGEYIECLTCKNTYNDKVLELAADVEADRKAFESEYERAVRKSMAIMVLADGVVDESEIDAMTSIYNSLTGKDASREDMALEIETTKNEDLAIEDYLESINGQVNANGKELVVRALISIAYADGDFDEEEQKTLIKALSALDITENHFKEIMDDFKS
jgi:uncharacterized tellurite resistance protein B-like protein